LTGTGKGGGQGVNMGPGRGVLDEKDLKRII